MWYEIPIWQVWEDSWILLPQALSLILWICRGNRPFIWVQKKVPGEAEAQESYKSYRMNIKTYISTDFGRSKELPTKTCLDVQPLIRRRLGSTGGVWGISKSMMSASSQIPRLYQHLMTLFLTLHVAFQDFNILLKRDILQASPKHQSTAQSVCSFQHRVDGHCPTSFRALLQHKTSQLN